MENESIGLGLDQKHPPVSKNRIYDTLSTVSPVPYSVLFSPIQMAMSPVFLEYLEDRRKGSVAKVISIMDFPGPAVEAFVRYLYYQELDPLVLDEHLADMWGLADKYQVELLRQYVVKLQPNFVTVKNVVDIVTRADLYGAKEIKDFCLRFMVKHTKTIQKQEVALRMLPQNLLADYLVTYHR